MRLLLASKFSWLEKIKKEIALVQASLKLKRAKVSSSRMISVLKSWVIEIRDQEDPKRYLKICFRFLRYPYRSRFKVTTFFFVLKHFSKTLLFHSKKLGSSALRVSKVLQKVAPATSVPCYSHRCMLVIV